MSRCRRVSHAFSRLMRARSRRRMRSLRATVRSHAWNRRCRRAFHYQKRGGRARVLSCFVGGAPLIYAPRHCDVREWVTTTSVTFLFFLLPSHHADLKISMHTQCILSATDNMEAAQNCLCTFFCLWNWHNAELYFFSRASLLHLLQVNIIVIKTLRLTFKRRCHRLRFLITWREELIRLLHSKCQCCMMRLRRLPWVSRCRQLSCSYI